MSKKIDQILADALVEKGLVAQTQMDTLAREADGSGEGLQTILLKKGALSERDILIVLAGRLRLPYVQLKELTVEKSVLDKVPVKIASYYKFVPLDISGRILTIVVAAPLDIRTRDEIRIQLGYEIEIALAEQNDIIEVLAKWQGTGTDTVEKIVASPRRKVVPRENVKEETVSWVPKEPSRTRVNKEKKLLGEILIEKGLLTEEQLAMALGEQVITKELLGAILVRKGLVKEKDILAALSQRYNLPLVDLKNRQIDWNIIKHFSSSLIFDCHCVPFERDERSVTMAISNPLDAWTIKRAEDEARGLELKLALTSQEDIDDVIKRYQLYIQESVPESLG